MINLEGKRVLITGGTGSLGKVLTSRLLKENLESLRIMSRDEAKQYFMGKKLNDPRVQFQVGDVRNLSDVVQALQGIDIVFNTAALKQVPSCEYGPYQAVQTNITGAENIVNAISMFKLPVDTVVGISTDKACKPVNVMGMTKALQERIFIHGNLRCSGTRFVCARYGNILASRGSLIPLFHQFIADKKPLTVTSTEMTRFLLNLDEAVDLILLAMHEAYPGEIYIPRVASGRIVDIAEVFSQDSGLPVEITGIRPGEKLHEILVSEEEAFRTLDGGKTFMIQPQIDGFTKRTGLPAYDFPEYSSSMFLMNKNEIRARLDKEQLLPGQFDPERFK